MAQQSLSEKLQLGSGQNLRLLGVPENLATPLGGLGADRNARGVLVFVRDSSEVAGAANEIADAAATADGLAWVAYPKRSSGIETDLSRDRGWEPLTDAGLRPVRQVALDEKWSALRFRRVEHTGG